MKKILIIFIVLGMLVCSIPLVGMVVRPTTVSTENRVLSSFPSLLSSEGGVNLNFFQEFEKYFNEHFAFRNELVYADAKIQNDIFRVSSTERVVSGKDGWLFYTSTLNDYLGTNNLSDRELYNIAHNLEIVKDYLDERGIEFILTIPPNKSTLYGDYMPYYNSIKIDEEHNVDRLKPLIDGNIAYADLFELFREEDEILYLKRDSHWNMKGALLAYNCIMDSLGQKHDDYSGVNVKRSIDEVGDLSKMLYTLYGEKEANFKYDIPQNYEYNSDFNSVEDGWIETKSNLSNGKLLMFRDSFANTLIPLIANQYSEAYFSKAVPHDLEKMIVETEPDTVIFEKVERNIADFIKMPPIMSSVNRSNPEKVKYDNRIETKSTVVVNPSVYDSSYIEISGLVEYEGIKTNTEICLNVNGTLYSAYHIGENGYLVYLDKSMMTNTPIIVKIVLIDGSDVKVLEEHEVNWENE